MGMVIKTNIQAINANRNLRKNNKKSAASLEKLASGFKINRAGDDASGLAISEKMKAQITALGTSSNNCEDGISLIQTAEGYMEEIHNMLNRMVELAEKSANGILEDSGNTGFMAYGVTGGVQNAGTDRAALQMEMDQLCAEIDRIALTANFNGNKLFYPNDEERSRIYQATGGSNDPEKLKAWGTWVKNNDEFMDNYNYYSLQVGETANKGDKVVLGLKFMTTDALFFKLTTDATLAKDPSKLEHDIIYPDGTVLHDQSLIIPNQQYQGLAIDNIVLPFVGNSSQHTWGCTFNISDPAFASKVAEVVRTVIDDVSMQRAQLGAMQNRLEYTINNLDTAKENIQTANSRIRDTDMAKEMMSYTQNNVLTQAAQAMLAQANTQPQNVLQLLQ